MNSIASNRARDKPPLASFQYMLNHVILPPQLPQEDDYDAEHEAVLLDTVLDCLCDFKKYVGSEEVEITDLAIAMMTNLRDTQDTSRGVFSINEKELCKALKTLGQHDQHG